MAATISEVPAGDMDGSVNQAPKTFHERLNDLPLYTVTWSQICAAYTSLRERNDVLRQAFDTGEQFVSSVATSAKPVVTAAATSALKMAKPVVGEVEDPVAKLDSVASQALAKAEETFPIITQSPSEIVEKTKAVIKDTASTCVEKLQGTTVAQTVNSQVENAVSLSELMVELCFPTLGHNLEDLAELEQAEEDEDKGVVVRVKNLGSRVRRRGTRKVLALKPVQVTVDAVHYAQERIQEMNEKLTQGSNFVSKKAGEAKEFIQTKVDEVEYKAQRTVSDTSKIVQDEARDKLTKVYATSMYLPSKAIAISGEVVVSAKDMVFSYTQAHAVSEMPHAVVEMMENYYAKARANLPEQVSEIADKAVAFVVVPAQVLTEYVLNSRPVQWVIPNVIHAEEIKIIEGLSLEEIEGDLRDA